MGVRAMVAVVMAASSPIKVTPFGDRRALQGDGLDVVQGPACAADISDDGKVNVEDLLALLASYGSSCVEDASRGALECDTTINLDQLDTVVASMGAENGGAFNDRGNPGTVVDMDHTPGAWTSSPTADYDTCADQAFMTINLGAPHSLTGATI